MNDQEARQMASLAACLHEQIERLLRAKEWDQVKRIKRLKRLTVIAETLEQTATNHRQAVERYLLVADGSEKEVSEADRQSASLGEHVAEIWGISAVVFGHAAETDDGS